MISERTVFQTSTPSVVTRASPIGRLPLAGAGVIARRISGALNSWVSAPIQPYAALWEASTFLGLMNEPTKTFDSDAESTEAPFLTDTWPRP